MRAMSLLRPFTLGPCAATPRPYRVCADWPGGGFGYMIEASSQAEALAWAKKRAHMRPDAVVTAEVWVEPLERAVNERRGGR